MPAMNERNRNNKECRQRCARLTCPATHLRMSFLTTIFGKIFSQSTAQQEKQIVAIAAGTVGAYNPGLGALIEMIGNAVYSVEIAGAGMMSGPDKKAQVQHIIDVSSPLTLATIQQITGKPFVDPPAVAPALDSIIDDTVTLFHAIGVFPSKATASIPSTTMPSPSATAGK